MDLESRLLFSSTIPGINTYQKVTMKMMMMILLLVPIPTIQTTKTTIQVGRQPVPKTSSCVLEVRTIFGRLGSGSMRKIVLEGTTSPQKSVQIDLNHNFDGTFEEKAKTLQKRRIS